MSVRPWLVLAAVGALAGCASGPAYQSPLPDLATRWKLEAPWREGRPDDAAAKGAWWQAFADAELDRLEQQALAHSPTLALAQARLAQARAALVATSAPALPQLGLGERAARQKISANRPLSNYSSLNYSTVQNELSAAMSVNYELDLAARVDQSIAAAQASVGQSAADLENTRLLLGADLAANYFNLRALDAELGLLQRSIAWQQRALELASSRRELGAASGLELAQQQTLLDTTLVQRELLVRQRGQYEHAVATLCGLAAPQFTLTPQVGELKAPAVPLGLPSELLQRRPDIASAERAMAGANAQIGVANAAFYPGITLGSTLGADSRNLGTLFNAPSLLWSLGLSATQTLFDGGRTRANVDFARAGYDATVANYRRVVLTAMQEVQDGITGLQALERTAAQAELALASARRVAEMTSERYQGGASAYFEVIAAQQALLASERQATQLLGQRLVTTVFLVKALGGDWHSRLSAQ